MTDSQAPITLLLQRVNDGEDGAMDRLMGQVHADLSKLAEAHLRRQYGAHLPGVTMEPGALVNETYLRLIKQRQHYDNRGHFFAIATRVMLRVLMDYHRSRSAAKRGGGQAKVTLTMMPAEGADAAAYEIPRLVDAFEKLEKLDERSCTVAKLRVLWGLTQQEIAESLELSLSTVDREWRFARRWLTAELG